MTPLLIQNMGSVEQKMLKLMFEVIYIDHFISHLSIQLLTFHFS